MTTKYTYMFSEGKKEMKDILGGKGANLAEMTIIGLPVPQGFTITTEGCRQYWQNDMKSPEGLWEQMKESVAKLEDIEKKKLNDVENPLLVSVRSGAAISMPGMMDTILNLGLNDNTVEGLAKRTKDERFAYDCYRRFIQMYGEVVLEVDAEKFEETLAKKKEEKGVSLDTDLDGADLKDLAEKFRNIIRADGKDFPNEPMEQLRMAVLAVFNSWNTPRAKTYRKLNKIPDNIGTAVNVQTMVFGNSGAGSATGVAFTRNPATGDKEYYGEFLLNAQGEDVVAGTRTPRPVVELENELPGPYKEFIAVYDTLEKHYKDIQDFEFTIEKEKFYMLQTRAGKRTAQAAIKIAVDMVKEELITKEEAILRIEPQALDQLLHLRIDTTHTKKPITTGISASPGAAVGKVVFTADDAVRWHEKGEQVILVRIETKPDDIHGFVGAEGILTSRGGKTSHAAVVARGMGKACVAGCEEMAIDYANSLFKVGEHTVKLGDVITIDGGEGHIYIGEVPLVEPELGGELDELLGWADEIRKLGVMANTDTPEGAKKANRFGAEGIGLCRTERMFNDPERLPLIREMILAETLEERMKYIEMLLPMQKGDFIGIFKEMEGKPVIVRLLDPPLHEFLPTIEEVLDQIREDGIDEATLAEKQKTLARVRDLHEINPMLGHRGVRLGISHPEIYEMQVKSICEAVAELTKDGVNVKAEIMIPQVCTAEELKWSHKQVDKAILDAEAKYGVKVTIKFGTMIEVVRACMRAGRFAENAEFFSFGTNDLTQATFSFSREDAEGKFLPLYNERKILQDNPFEILDQKGVGRLMQMAVEWGRKTRKDLEVGICGEHGGEPSSIGFAHVIGLNYVSCSPFRVPIARIAAAQAALKTPEELSLIHGKADNPT